jgi:hypothetical protein
MALVLLSLVHQYHLGRRPHRLRISVTMGHTHHLFLAPRTRVGRRLLLRHP